MRRLDDLMGILKRLPHFQDVDHQRVYLVTVPPDEQRWPSCVVARDGGNEIGFLGPGEGAQVQSVRIEVLGDALKYSEIEDAMESVRAAVDHLSLGTIEPPDDVWNDVLGVIQQTIRVNLLP